MGLAADFLSKGTVETTSYGGSRDPESRPLWKTVLLAGVTAVMLLNAVGPSLAAAAELGPAPPPTEVASVLERAPAAPALPAGLQVVRSSHEVATKVPASELAAVVVNNHGRALKFEGGDVAYRAADGQWVGFHQQAPSPAVAAAAAKVAQFKAEHGIDGALTVEAAARAMGVDPALATSADTYRSQMERHPVKIGKAVGEVAAAYGIAVGDGPSYAAMMKQAETVHEYAVLKYVAAIGKAADLQAQGKLSKVEDLVRSGSAEAKRTQAIDAVARDLLEMSGNRFVQLSGYYHYLDRGVAATVTNFLTGRDAKADILKAADDLKSAFPDGTDIGHLSEADPVVDFVLVHTLSDSARDWTSGRTAHLDNGDPSAHGKLDLSRMETVVTKKDGTKLGYDTLGRFQAAVDKDGNLIAKAQDFNVGHYKNPPKPSDRPEQPRKPYNGPPFG